jgi:hypothetical protein
MSALGQRLAKLQQALKERSRVLVIRFAPMPGAHAREQAALPPGPGFYRLNGEVVGLLGGSPAARARVLASLQEARTPPSSEVTAAVSQSASVAAEPLGTGVQEAASDSYVTK